MESENKTDPKREEIIKRRKLRRLKWRIKRIVRISIWVVLLLSIIYLLRSCLSSPEETPANARQTPTAKASPTPAATKTSVTDPPVEKIKCIMIDPGHGGKESPGTVNAGIYERELNLQVAVKLKAKLEELGYAVLMMREEDVYISPQNRAVIAEESEADILVSIHHNALENDTVTNGMETLYNNGANEQNSVLASHIQRETVNTTGAKNRGILSDTKVILIRNLTLPACLIELGFLTEPNERALLASPEYQEKIAQGIANGIDKYFESLK